MDSLKKYFNFKGDKRDGLTPPEKIEPVDDYEDDYEYEDEIFATVIFGDYYGSHSDRT